jgi:undecaprenyl-diphosphatase
VNVLEVIILSLIQGARELLPVSSSAHVLVAAKLMGINPSSPEMDVPAHNASQRDDVRRRRLFWKSWRYDYFSSSAAIWNTAKELVVASFATAMVGGILLVLIEKVAMHGQPHAEVESLFGNFALISLALAAVGILIVISGRGRQEPTAESASTINEAFERWAICMDWSGAGSMPSFSRVFAVGRNNFNRTDFGWKPAAAEKFSFALAVILTPPGHRPRVIAPD